MVIDIKYVFIVIWAASLMMLILLQIARPKTPTCKWNWKHPHEILLVTIFVNWLMIFVANAYGWSISF